MLGFKINNEDLDMTPGTVLELEQNNPFLQFNEEIAGEYSMPFELQASPDNIRLTQLAALIQKRVNVAGIEATAYDGGLQHSIGKIKIEKSNIDLNRTQNGKLSCYYLTGTSFFYNDIRGKKLKDINAGGDRVFSWDNFSRNGSGFWGHIHKVIDAPAGYGSSGYDYAFYPMVNESFTWDISARTFGGNVTNNMTYAGGQVNFTQFCADGMDANKIVPFPYLKYVLNKISEYTGWKFDGAILNDPDFLKITMWDCRAIDWAYYIPARVIILGGGPIKAKPTISFNLINHLPDISISEFLLSLRNRLGIYYDVDRRSKVVRFTKLVDVAASTIKEYTSKAGPLVTKSVLPEKKIYSLKTKEDSGPINLSGLSDQGSLLNKSSLPLASEARDLQVYLVISENNYYICQQNETSGAYEWKIYDSNTRDVVPEGATEEITTGALTTGNEYLSPYLDLIPRWDETGFWPGRTEETSSITLLLLFYHGIKNNKAGQPYPFASHHIYDSQGVQVGNWSLSFLGKKTDGTDVGLYHKNWKPFLDKLTTREQLEVTLYLPRHEYMKLKFSDVISIAGVRMYVSRVKATIPYSGTVQLECSRI
jgi:hypothetical protein